MKSREIKIRDLTISNDKPFTLIAGLNVLESKDLADEVIEECISVTKELEIPFIFKSSFDKANRSSIESYRGPGVEKGLEILADLKLKHKVPVLSDVHTQEQVEMSTTVLDVIQIPAFLCRQTDLLSSVADTGLPMNIKKGQFLSPHEIENIVNKILFFKNENILICERGTSFGYNNLVVDMVGISQLKTYSFPVIFDVTHSLQQPGGLGDKSGGRRHHVLNLAKSAISLGLAGLFVEVHPDPKNAKCDGPCALPLNLLKDFLMQLKKIDELVKTLPNLEII